MKKFSYLLITILLFIIVPTGISNPVEAQDPKYYLYLNIVGSGVITYNGTSPYNAGDVVNLTAYAAADWEFSGWGGDLGGSVNPEYLTMDSNKTVTCYFTEIPEIPSIESCNFAGVRKDTFSVGDDMYVNGTGFGNYTTYYIYAVEDQVWSDGMTIPIRIPGTATTVMSMPDGTISPTLAWANPLVPGKYDIVVDVNNNTKYDVGIDALDDNDIEVTAGFFVVPEVAIGSVMAIASMFMALGLFIYSKKRKPTK